MTVNREFNMTDAIDTLFGRDLEAVRNIVGARLVSATKDAGDLLIVTDRGTLRGVAEGDCCSSSWVESVECDAPAGSVFTDRILLDDPSRPVPDWHNGCENKVYFGTLYTDRGRISWEMRNESNGYYGGSIDWQWTPSATADLRAKSVPTPEVES